MTWSGFVLVIMACVGLASWTIAIADVVRDVRGKS